MFVSPPRPTHRRQPHDDGTRLLRAWQSWRPRKPAPRTVATVAELAECECPDLCNRDHDND